LIRFDFFFAWVYFQADLPRLDYSENEVLSMDLFDTFSHEKVLSVEFIEESFIYLVDVFKQMNLPDCITYFQASVSRLPSMSGSYLTILSDAASGLRFGTTSV